MKTDFADLIARTAAQFGIAAEQLGREISALWRPLGRFQEKVQTVETPSGNRKTRRTHAAQSRKAKRK